MGPPAAISTNDSLSGIPDTRAPAHLPPRPSRTQIHHQRFATGHGTGSAGRVKRAHALLALVCRTLRHGTSHLRAEHAVARCRTALFTSSTRVLVSLCVRTAPAYPHSHGGAVSLGGWGQGNCPLLLSRRCRGGAGGRGHGERGADAGGRVPVFGPGLIYIVGVATPSEFVPRTRRFGACALPLRLELGRVSSSRFHKCPFVHIPSVLRRGSFCRWLTATLPFTTGRPGSSLLPPPERLDRFVFREASSTGTERPLVLPPTLKAFSTPQSLSCGIVPDPVGI